MGTPLPQINWSTIGNNYEKYVLMGTNQIPLIIEAKSIGRNLISIDNLHKPLEEITELEDDGEPSQIIECFVTKQGSIVFYTEGLSFCSESQDFFVNYKKYSLIKTKEDALDFKKSRYHKTNDAFYPAWFIFWLQRTSSRLYQHPHGFFLTESEVCHTKDEGERK